MQELYRSIISGEQVGATAAILRACFDVAATGYSAAVQLRNDLFDRGVRKIHRLPVPVISVGNITTGGTGKTPTVIMLVQLLQSMGHRPAVLTRGYAAKNGAKADEVMVIEHECPNVPVVVNPDRVAGGQTAIRDHNADVLVMDDGFQHRRLHRDLNIVLADATEPLGIPGVVPRGTWREPPQNLVRADVIMLTRCEQVTQELADLAAGLFTQWVSPHDIFMQHTQVLGVYDAAGNRVNLTDKRVMLFAGIGNPQGFAHTVSTLGAAVSGACWFDDHHNYDVAKDFRKLAQVSQHRQIDGWVTTLKDWVKLREKPLPFPVYHVRIESRLQDRHQEMFRERLAEVISRRGVQ